MGTPRFIRSVSEKYEGQTQFEVQQEDGGYAFMTAAEAVEVNPNWQLLVNHAHARVMLWHWDLTDNTYIVSDDGEHWKAFYHRYAWKQVDRIFLPGVELTGTAEEVTQKISDYYG